MPLVGLSVPHGWKKPEIPRSNILRQSRRARNVTSDVKIKRVRELSKLRLLLAQDEDGLETYVYPKLQLGDVWWIPDDISGFSDRERHPWVIVRSYSPNQSHVVACPRTTQTTSPQHGLATPAGVLPGLDKRGFLLLKFRRPFIAKGFREYRYIGKLPHHWIEEIRTFYRGQAQDKAR